MCSAAYEARFKEELKSLSENVDSESEEGKALLHSKLSTLQNQLANVPDASGELWEGLGHSWAECGQFLEAIKAYRYAVTRTLASLVCVEVDAFRVADVVVVVVVNDEDHNVVVVVVVVVVIVFFVSSSLLNQRGRLSFAWGRTAFPCGAVAARRHWRQRSWRTCLSVTPSAFGRTRRTAARTRTLFS